MAGRVTSFGRDAETRNESRVFEDENEWKRPVHVDVEVSSRLVDEVVDEALKDVPDSDAAAIRYLWARDPNNSMAKAYFAQEVKMRTASTFAQLNKKKISIDEVLTSEETARIIAYASEFDVVFKQSVSHDHGFHSARRKIDMMKLQCHFPVAMPLMDVGGSVTYHVSAGHTNVLVVSPFNVDFKDPQRMQLTRLRLRRIAQDESYDSVSKAMASSVLASEGRYHLSETAQTVAVKGFKASISCHVYDVSLMDWANMMERCYLQVHEGCIHWSSDFLYKQQGILEYSGSYFEIDDKADLIRMRIGESSSAWYEHKWSQYMQYAANQVLVSGTSKYSYEIIERKEDTIFFRIMRVGDKASANHHQVYKLPDVKMVHVKGFAVEPNPSRSDKGLRNRLEMVNYVWPEALWNLMIRYCMNETLRGGFSYDKAYNYYRTVVPDQSILGVHVRGGQKVSMEQLPALIVMAAIVAHEEMMTTKRTVRYQTEFIQQERGKRSEWTLFKFVKTFWESTKFVVSIPFLPFTFIPFPATQLYGEWSRDISVSWRPRVEVRSLNMALVVDTKSLDFDVMTPLQVDYRDELASEQILPLVDLVRSDQKYAELVLKSCGSALPESFQQELTSIVGDSTLVPDTESGGSDKIKTEDGVTWYNDKFDGKPIRKEVFPQPDVSEVVRYRRLAVAEAIQECEAELDACSYTCARIYRELVSADRIAVEVIAKRKEELYNPDVWLVKRGLLVKSMVYDDVKFSYGAVYIPVPDADGVCVQPVYEENWSGADSETGKFVTREYLKLPYEYSGYALVIDGLRIYNGPRVIDTLKRVMNFSDAEFQFQVIAHQGPAGCGKTTSIVRNGDPSRDAFMAPGRLSIVDMRDKLVEHHKTERRRVLTVARTLDSFLVNYDRLPDAAKQGFRSLLFDEYVLARSGKIIAAVVLLGMREIHVYGDKKQISHIPRVSVSDMYAGLKVQVEHQEFITYRCAPRILAAVNHIYDFKARSAQVSGGLGEVIAVKSFDSIRWMKDVMVLTFYQAEKKVVKQLLRSSHRDVRVSTVHEAQGLAADQVVLYNSEVRSRPLDDPSGYLANKPEYCLVAITRARFSFVYWKPSMAMDMVMSMVDRAKDPRRVAACQDMPTQGSSLEYL